MNPTLDVLLVGLVLCADSFSAALAMGFRPHTNRDSLKFALSSGTAEALVTLVGALAGAKVIAQFADYDHWIAFGLLMAVALHMIHESIEALRQGGNGGGGLESTESAKNEMGFHSFTKILIVSFATSLDALGVGVGLGVLERPILPYIISIGIWAFLATLAGLYFARRIPKRYGSVFGLVGALVLVVMAIQMLEI